MEPVGIRVVAPSRVAVGEQFVVNGVDVETLYPDNHWRIVERDDVVVPTEPNDFLYVRIVTDEQNMAWSSPRWTA